MVAGFPSPVGCRARRTIRAAVPAPLRIPRVADGWDKRGARLGEGEAGCGRGSLWWWGELASRSQGLDSMPTLPGAVMGPWLMVALSLSHCTITRTKRRMFVA